MKALLIRIGVDQAFGSWNAPVDPASGQFVYVPIPESSGTPFHPALERRYAEVLPALQGFCQCRNLDVHNDIKFPSPLLSHSMHLDPDFDHLTYGDDGAARGAGLVGMIEGDLLVFYGGLSPCRPCEHKLVYAIVGLYVVQKVLPVADVAPEDWKQNAHTRKSKRGNTDVVVWAKPDVSGRLNRCIPIGERRGGAYRVRQDILDAWGGLSVKDGFIQRSAVPPSFRDPARFYDWFRKQGVSLMASNN